MNDYDPWRPTDDREIGKGPTAEKLRNADDLFQFTLKERKELFGFGNRGVMESGLCDGQTCVHHVVKPYGVTGCACRLARPDHPKGRYFRDRHQIVCSHNGENEVKEWGCRGFRSDPTKTHDRKKPAYMQRAYARKVI